MRCCSCADSRAYSGSTSVSCSCAAAQEVGGVVDLPLAGQEHERVAVPGQLVDGVADRLHLVAVVGRPSHVVAERAVAHLDRVRPPGHLDDRRVDAVDGEVAGEAGRVDRRRRDDHLEVGPPRQQLAEVAEDEVDVEAALVGLVDDQRVVAAEVADRAAARRAGCRRSSPARASRRATRSSKRTEYADVAADRRAELLGDALGDRARRDAPRLGVADQPVDAAAELEAQLGQLGALARARSRRRRRRPGGRGSPPAGRRAGR